MPICINGRSEEALQAAREKVYYAASAANVTTVAVDLSTSDGCDELVDRVPDVDILVNNLRIYEPKAVFDTPDEDWQRMFDVDGPAENCIVVGNELCMTTTTPVEIGPR